MADENDESAAEAEHGDSSGNERSLVNGVEEVNQHTLQLCIFSNVEVD